MKPNISRRVLLMLCVSLLLVQFSWATPNEKDASITQTFSVQNMTCAACPITVRKAILRVEGVRKVDVNFEKKMVTTTYDPAKANPTAIAEASAEVGFPAQPVEDEAR